MIVIRDATVVARRTFSWNNNDVLQFDDVSGSNGGSTNESPGCRDLVTYQTLLRRWGVYSYWPKHTTKGSRLVCPSLRPEHGLYICCSGVCAGTGV